jgi:hypothetical protein
LLNRLYPCISSKSEEDPDKLELKIGDRGKKTFFVKTMNVLEGAVFDRKWWV